jgi:transcriptional regulator with XRE-family HTH domain
MLNAKSIGNKIAEVRKKNGLSQAELAQQVSISAQAVGKWERGESMPDITTLNRVAAIFGVDLNYFFQMAFKLMSLYYPLKNIFINKQKRYRKQALRKNLPGIGTCRKETGLMLIFRG